MKSSATAITAGGGKHVRPSVPVGLQADRPDLARVGGRYSDEWHVDHLVDPRSVVPESVMPPYGHLARRELDFGQIEAELRTNRIVGVPYTDEMIAKAEDDLRLQVNPDADDLDAFMVRYPKAQVRDFDGNPERLSELDALLAYLQMLGTLVDFDVFRAEGENLR